MEIRVKKGAIVSFVLKPRTAIVPYSCKVLEINDDDVVIVEQVFVSMKDVQKWSGVKTKDLNHRVSVDFGTPYRIPKSSIIDWHYSIIPNDNSVYYSSYNPSDLAKMAKERINYYDYTGMCKGNGEYLE